MRDHRIEMGIPALRHPRRFRRDDFAREVELFAAKQKLEMYGKMGGARRASHYLEKEWSG